VGVDNWGSVGFANSSALCRGKTWRVGLNKGTARDRIRERQGVSASTRSGLAFIAPVADEETFGRRVPSNGLQALHPMGRIGTPEEVSR